MNKLGGMVMTHNNSRTIRDCINSIKSMIDELIIIDDYSTDDTLEIIKKIYPKVEVHQRSLDNDFAAQRNFALTKPKNEWVLFIDSDEVVSDKLKTEILEVLKSPKFDAYKSRRDNLYLDLKSKSNSGRPILLKRNLRFEGKLHENVYGVERGFLKSPLLHLGWKDTESWVGDLNRYSTWNAKKWIADNRNFNKFQIFLIGFVYPLYHFLQKLLWEGRWKGGWRAMIYCMAWSAEWSISAMKYYELRYMKK